MLRAARRRDRLRLVGLREEIRKIRVVEDAALFGPFAVEAGARRLAAADRVRARERDDLPISKSFAPPVIRAVAFGSDPTSRSNSRLSDSKITLSR
jgi:hypothetical protein